MKFGSLLFETFSRFIIKHTFQLEKNQIRIIYSQLFLWNLSICNDKWSDVLTNNKTKRAIFQQEDDKEKHVAYLTSAPIVCLALQRENAVKKLLDLIGPEDPQSARRNSQFYWRGVFGADPVCNGLYCKLILLGHLEIKPFITNAIRLV